MVGCIAWGGLLAFTKLSRSTRLSWELDLLSGQTRHIWLLAVLWADSHVRCLAYMRHGHSSWLLDGSFFDFLWVVVCCTLILRVTATAAMLLLVWLDTLSALNFNRVETHTYRFKAVWNFLILADWNFAFRRRRRWEKPFRVILKNWDWLSLNTFRGRWLGSQTILPLCRSPIVIISSSWVRFLCCARLSIMLMKITASTVVLVI